VDVALEHQPNRFSLELRGEPATLPCHVRTSQRIVALDPKPA
jgi:hypothetical protein